MSGRREHMQTESEQMLSGHSQSHGQVGGVARLAKPRQPNEEDDIMRIDERVDHPPHYNTCSIEVIDAIEDWGLGFHEGNIVKYIARAKHKDDEIVDLLKARWYLDRLIGLKEKARCNTQGD